LWNIFCALGCHFSGAVYDGNPLKFFGGVWSSFVRSLHLFPQFTLEALQLDKIIIAAALRKPLALLSGLYHDRINACIMQQH
jgi:hypothetical protein